MRREMEPSSFSESNAVLSKPSNMTDDECSALSTFRGQDEHGHPIIVSCWKITKEELEIITKTGRVWLVVCGVSMPPVMLLGDNPFKPTSEPTENRYG